MRDLNIALVQEDLIWEQPAANRERLEERLAALRPADLIILPEMFTTGFSMDAARLAERPDGPTMAWMKRLAEQHDAAICGSWIVEEGGRWFNRLHWVLPDGSARHYDKRHLFSLAGEQNVYAPGRERIVLSWRDWRICPLICYDLRFPVWSRNTDNYDLLLYVANWPARRAYAWNTLLRARAIENLAWVAAVNRCGSDGNGEPHSGDSQVVDPLGAVVAEAGDSPGLLQVSLSGNTVSETRKRFAFLQDRDAFTLQPDSDLS